LIHNTPDKNFDWLSTGIIVNLMVEALKELQIFDFDAAEFSYHLHNALRDTRNEC